MTEVALAVGFESLGHFNSSFRSFLGIFPCAGCLVAKPALISRERGGVSFAHDLRLTPMKVDLINQVALVMGAARGIGVENVARQLGINRTRLSIRAARGHLDLFSVVAKKQRSDSQDLSHLLVLIGIKPRRSVRELTAVSIRGCLRTGANQSTVPNGRRPRE